MPDMFERDQSIREHVPKYQGECDLYNSKAL